MVAELTVYMVAQRRGGHTRVVAGEGVERLGDRVVPLCAQTGSVDC